VAAGTGLADIAGEEQRQIGGPVHLGGMKPVVDSLALVDGGRLDGGEVFGQTLH
jgi:hypothetical protein